MAGFRELGRSIARKAAEMTHAWVNCGETADSKGVIGIAATLCHQSCTEIAEEPIFGERRSFQLFWDYQQPKRAGRHLEKWMRSAMRSRLEPFKSPSAIVHSGSALPRTSLQRSITAAPGYPYQSNANHTFGTGA